MSDLATYSIEWKIKGMTVPDTPPGVGDRSLRFEIAIDPTDLEAATDAWYAHLEVMLGPDEVAKIRAQAEGWARQGRGR